MCMVFKCSSTGATRIESGGYYEPTANNVTSVTIYAECTPNTYNISLKPNGGTLGTSKPTSGTYDRAVTISYPTRGGYNFTGWLGNTVVDSTTAKYGNSSTVSEINTSWSTPTTTKVKKNYFKNLTPVKNATVELTAQWGAIEYNIDYNLKYGTNDSSAPTKMKYDEPKQIKNPTKTIKINVSKGTGTYGTNAGSGVTLNPTTASAAQTFAGWTADDGLNTSTAYTGSASNSVNTKWSNKDTKVKTEWFKNLRNTSDGKVTLIANWTKVDVTMPEITKKGYECWYNTANDQSGTKIVSGGKYVTSENTKASVPIYSFCKANQYNVTLNNQGASTAGSTSITPTFDAAMPSITKPAKTFKVTYNYNGNGTSNTEATSTYTFGGYYDKTGGEGKQYINSSGTSANVWDKDSDTTLYAKWTGGSVTLPSPKRSGYAFDGWYNGNTKVGVGGATYYPTATITLTAHWTACGPGYYLNGNTCAKCGKNKYSTGTANASCTSCKDGYTTTGETSTSKTDCKITCTENQTVKTANSKCEACSKGYGRAGNETVSEGNVGTACRLIKYSISYTLNGGTVSPANKTEYYVTTESFTLNNPTKAGYNFTGWTGTGLSSASSSVTISKGSTGNRTYTANWKDSQPPSCSLSATASGITMTYSDNVGVSNYGLTTSNSANYNSKKTASLAAGTFYGWVKDAAGNTGNCKVSIETTKETKWTATKQTCSYYISSYNCSIAATATYATTASYTIGNKTYYQCGRTEKYTCKTSATATGKCTCRRGSVASNGCNSSGGGSCYCDGYQQPSASNGWCSMESCYYYERGSCSVSYSCSTGSRIGSMCYLYNQSSCGSWTKHSTTYTYGEQGGWTEYGVKDCTGGGYSSCTSSTYQQQRWTCSITSRNNCPTGYVYAGTTCKSKTPTYSCSSGSLSGSTCYLNGISYKPSGWSCSNNYSYQFDTSSLTNQTSCSTGNKPSCSSTSHSGNNYISACTATEWACKTSGYTKINNSWCYKY